MHFELPPTHRFEIVSQLGAGGMGAVYAAYDRVNQSRVALKALSSMSAELIRLFKNEFRALADLAHPNLARLGELFEHEAQWFFTMELIDGVDFLTYVRNRSVIGDSSEPTSDVIATSEVDGAVLLRAHRLSNSAISTMPAPSALSVSFDEARLRASLAGLVRGLNALHQTQKIHRDIKPSALPSEA